MTPHTELREQLAALQHEQWAGWMEYMLGKCLQSSTGNTEDVVIPAGYAHNLVRLMQTPYSELTEQEKESDRIEADKYLPIFEAKRQEWVKEFAEELKDALYPHATDDERAGIRTDVNTIWQLIDDVLAHLKEGV